MDVQEITVNRDDSETLSWKGDLGRDSVVWKLSAYFAGLDPHPLVCSSLTGSTVQRCCRNDDLLHLTQALGRRAGKHCWDSKVGDPFAPHSLCQFHYFIASNWKPGLGELVLPIRSGVSTELFGLMCLV